MMPMIQGHVPHVGAEWSTARPFSHVVIDNFFDQNVAQELADSFPSADSKIWWEYQNPLEVKLACSLWDKFPPSIYRAMFYLTSREFTQIIKQITGENVYADYGLHGGGLHCHRRGGKLNPHLDYSIHPKLKLQRKLNLIVYLSKDWDTSWRGGLTLYEHDPQTRRAGKPAKTVDCLFNRAVLFDTTQNSWHGLPDEIQCPEEKTRNSIAVYYLQDPKTQDFRQKVLFAPTESQRGQQDIEDMILRRSQVDQANSVYKQE